MTKKEQSEELLTMFYEADTSMASQKELQHCALIAIQFAIKEITKLHTEKNMDAMIILDAVADLIDLKKEIEKL